MMWALSQEKGIQNKPIRNNLSSGLQWLRGGGGGGGGGGGVKARRTNKVVYKLEIRIKNCTV